MRTSEKIRVAKLQNGLTVLGEEMEGVSSSAFSLLIPCGAVSDPDGREGTSSVLADMLSKGAGSRNSRELSEALEALGAHYGHSCGVEVTIHSCVVLGENLLTALELVSDIVLKPHLPEDELESVRQLALQQLRAIEDEPSHKVMVELAHQLYPGPYGRYQGGTEEGLNNLTIDLLRTYHAEGYVPSNAILAIAGNFSWEIVLRRIEECFGRWEGSRPLLPDAVMNKATLTKNIERDTAQVQIALAYQSVPIKHPDYYVAKVGVGILSGGMSGRLFVEVREKRGLVYHVSASHSTARSRAAVYAYAGTTPAHADETLQVVIQELRGLQKGASKEELQRAKADLKARVIMQGELSSSRASSLVNDWWNLGRVRGVEEIRECIDAVSSDDLERHFSEYPVEGITLVTLGPKALELPK